MYEDVPELDVARDSHVSCPLNEQYSPHHVNIMIILQINGILAMPKPGV